MAGADAMVECGGVRKAGQEKVLSEAVTSTTNDLGRLLAPYAAAVEVKLHLHLLRWYIVATLMLL